ncbi:hypothetical protein FIBSPDRAFT_1043195 [Athelia psychrophila]|uniref:Uncharacterized protein n=1 Tax=Athelia psychrophila TaxID=1759441 RepID=A0A166LKN6_9AGAM|nr:hypothetical protein FIBSPDRAFT_1043195 [Fibularhizoctonia sp. CBS 109695]
MSHSHSLLSLLTAVRQDIPSRASSSVCSLPYTRYFSPQADEGTDNKDKEEAEFSSKAQIVTLMATDVDRVAEFAWHVFAVIDSPIEIIVGTLFLSRLLGKNRDTF